MYIYIYIYILRFCRGIVSHRSKILNILHVDILSCHPAALKNLIKSSI